IARESLFTLCRIKRGDDIEIKGELEEKEFNYELENLVDKALRNREELKIARRALQISKESRKVARAQNLPRISAYGSYKWEYPDIAAERWADYWVAGARVDFPFLDGLSIFGRTKKNRAAVEEAAASEKNIREQVKLQVKVNFYNLKKTQKKIKVNKEKLKQAEENLDVSNRRYARGLLNNLELNEAILDYTGSRTEAASSLYNMLSAIEDIKLAVGEQLE
ncbi:MAG: TolC family protein, partial [Elusimicrobiota bacterium]|nr:TolC family protein [Elusimicrobiota bacterium]